MIHRKAGKIGAIALAVLCAALLSSTIDAQDGPLYDVELVIFRALSPSGSAEQWSTEEALAANGVTAAPESDGEETATPSADRAVRPGTVTVLAADQFKLTAVEESLKRSRDYQLLAHVGWTQAGYALNSASFVSLADNLSGTGVSGRAALSRGRYLHLSLDLVYQPQAGQQRYVLKQSRRMRSTERHYFDHPYFGVIAVVTPHNSSAS